MDITTAQQNCAKAAQKWAVKLRKEQPEGEGESERFWTEQFGYNAFDIVFGALPDEGWHTYLRQEPDVREELLKSTIAEAMYVWSTESFHTFGHEEESKPVRRLSKEEVVEAALAHEPEPFVPSEPHKVVEPVKPVKTGTTAEKLIGLIPTDLEQLSKSDVGRLLSLAGHAPMVLLLKGAKKYVFRDKSSIIVDVSGARAEKA